MQEYQALWNSVRDELKNILAPSTFEETFENVRRTAKEENGLIYIVCPNSVTKFKINQVYYPNIQSILRKITTRQVKFKFVLENEIVETQGKLFELVADTPSVDFEDFINRYMTGKTRSYLDRADAYLSNLNEKELYEYFCRLDGFSPKKGASLSGFAPDWIGQFYARSQWQENIPSNRLVSILPPGNSSFGCKNLFSSLNLFFNASILLLLVIKATNSNPVTLKIKLSTTKLCLK